MAKTPQHSWYRTSGFDALTIKHPLLACWPAGLLDELLIIHDLIHHFKSRIVDPNPRFTDFVIPHGIIHDYITGLSRLEGRRTHDYAAKLARSLAAVMR